METSKLWAKTKKDENGNNVIGENGYPVIAESLLHHMKAVGETAERFLTDSLYSGLRKDLIQYLGVSDEDVVSIVKYICAMHDIGKCHPSFQVSGIDLGEYAPKHHAQTRYRHEIGSEKIAMRIWEDSELFGDDGERTVAFFSRVLRLHHQGRNRKGMWYSVDDKWIELQDKVEKEIREWSGIRPFAVNGNYDAACVLLSALMILSDWIASSSDIDGAFRALRMMKTESLRAESFREMFGFGPRTLQKELADQLEGLSEMPIAAVIEAPMGEGKTEASLFLAYKMAEYWKKNGLYFALPTAATSNQMVGRVRQLVGDKGSTDLIHSTSWLIDDEEQRLDVDERQEYLQWKGPKKRALIARFGVGTVDQAMTTVMKVRYGVLRLLGLSNKVLIIDELHSYDAYMSTIIARLVEWCKELSIPVVMLSATLPKARKEQMLQVSGLESKAYPLVTEAFANGEAIELPISSVHKEWDVVIDSQEEISELPDTGCILIMANTVRKAIEIFEDLDVSPNEKLLFHSMFTVARKAEIEREVINAFGKYGDRPRRKILVATQVVEQSLDVDFDRMYTELAPIDLILQRIGRLYRHALPRPEWFDQPKCTIFGKGLGTGQYIYYKLLLERSKMLLDQTNIIHIPSDIPRLVEEVYRDEPDEALLEEYFEQMTDITIKRGTANSMILSSPDPNYFCLYSEDDLWEEDEEYLNAQTRLSADNVRLCIIPPELYDKAKDMTYINAMLARDIYPYMISAGKEIRKVIERNEHFRGSGRLAGCEIIRATEGSAPTDTLKCNGLRADIELGLLED